jgi:peptidoglycan hydrolase-like protein with peptidoglycan-binding domain
MRFQMRLVPLGLGNQGVAVARLQIGFHPPYPLLAVDGMYGPDTQRAVRLTQAATGAMPDGIYGPQTRHDMNWPVAGTGGSGCIGLG